MSPTTAKAVVHLTQTSDLMCPWCWVGLKKLQQASKQSNIDVQLEWKPFLLRPQMPEEGIPKSDPTPESRVSRRLKMAGQEVGIDFTGLTDRAPNTTLFHATMKHLQDELKMSSKDVTAYHEEVFNGYFTLGEFPDQVGLMKAASRVSNADVAASLKTLFQNSKKLHDVKKEVMHEARLASRRGISGVPSYEVDGQFLFSGAQPVESFVSVLEKLAQQ